MLTGVAAAKLPGNQTTSTITNAVAKDLQDGVHAKHPCSLKVSKWWNAANKASKDPQAARNPIQK